MFWSAFLQMHTRSIGRQLESKGQEGNKSRLDGQKEYPKEKTTKKKVSFPRTRNFFFPPLAMTFHVLLGLPNTRRFLFVHTDVPAQAFSCVRLFVTPWTMVHQAPLSMEFPRQEYWSGLPFPSLIYSEKFQLK